MIINTKRRGYYTVEAAIFLPIFIVAVLTVGYLMKVIGGVEGGMHACTDEARRQAAYAYVDKGGIGFSGRLEKRIKKEGKYVTRANVKNMSYLGADGRISFDVAYYIDFVLPLDLYDGFKVTDRLRCRGWIGKTYNDPFGFDAMEKDEDATIVYIFPMWGSKYHKKECTYVTAHPVQTVLTSGLRKQYDACALCKPGSLPDGSVVYCFPKYGGSFHRGNCNSVKKYTITIELEQAKQRGYTPCSKCGGT
jgi:hypothetical protein